MSTPYRRKIMSGKGWIYRGKEQAEWYNSYQTRAEAERALKRLKAEGKDAKIRKGTKTWPAMKFGTPIHPGYEVLFKSTPPKKSRRKSKNGRKI